MSNASIKPDDLKRAKELYFQYYPVTQIAEMTGIKRSSVQYHVMQRWKEERKMAKQDFMLSLMEGKENQLSKITDYSMRALEKALREVANRSEAPSVQEARNIVAILAKIDEIATKDKHAENSKKEEDHEEKPTSLEDIKKKLESDPFSSIS